MTKKIRWGILGAGNIAHAFARALPMSETGVLAGVGSRSKEKAELFLDQYDEGKAFGSYEALLEDPDIDAVYVCTPHPMHLEWTLKTAESGKHILCEKPMAVNSRDVKNMIACAEKHGVMLMEAFMYRCCEQTSRVCELIRENAIGELRLIRADFGFKGAYDLKSRLLNRDLAGGGILDVGCYPVSMARLLAGVYQGKDFANPLSLKAMGHVGAESQCDEWTVAILDFGSGLIAQCSTGVQLNLENKVQIFGSEGSLEILTPWFGGGEKGGISEIILKKSESETIEIENSPLYGREIDMMARAIEEEVIPWPAMGREDSLGNIATLDLWRKELGLTYPQDP